MKVKDLKEIISKFDDEDIVILSADGEGNGYSPLSDIEEGSYRAECDWSGEVGLKELTPDLINQGYTEEDILEDGVSAIILYPVN